MQENTQCLLALLARAASSRRLVITGHDSPDVDSVISCVLMKRLLARKGIAARIVLPTRADAQSRRVMARFFMDPDEWCGETQESDALILVDHHCPLHAGKVIACVDHHPTAEKLPYPYVQIEESGACAAMVLRLMQDAGVADDEDVQLAVTALYLDTIALRSTKIRPDEISWAKAEVKRLCMDEGFLLAEGLKLEDMTQPDSVLAMRGRKDYTFYGRRVVSTYVQTDAMTPQRLEALLAVIGKEMRACGAALWVFLVHDPMAGRTMQYDVTERGIRVKDYGRLASRGRDIMPQVERMIKEMGDTDGDDAAGAACRAGGTDKRT